MDFVVHIVEIIVLFLLECFVSHETFAIVLIQNRIP